MSNGIYDVITGANLVGVVKLNIDDAFEATNKGVKHFVDVVIKKIGTNNIKALRIWGHGIIYNKDRSDYPNGNLVFGPDNLNFDTVETFADSLKQLSPRFAKGARVELRGCRPARGNGREMMKKLARIWNVDVHGAEVTQSLIIWTSEIYVATPNGGFSKQRGIEVSEKR